MGQGLGGCLAEFTRNPPDHFGVDAGNRGGPFGGVIFDGLRHLVEADRVIGYEGFIVALFTDDHLDHSQVEGQVGAGPDWAPLSRLGGGFGEARVQVDDFGAARHGIHQCRGFRGGNGFHQVAAGQNDVVHIAVIAGRLFQAVSHQVRDDHGVEAQAALSAVVGRAEPVQQILELRLR